MCGRIYYLIVKNKTKKQGKIRDTFHSQNLLKMPLRKMENLLEKNHLNIQLFELSQHSVFFQTITIGGKLAFQMIIWNKTFSFKDFWRFKVFYCVRFWEIHFINRNLRQNSCKTDKHIEIFSWTTNESFWALGRSSWTLR